MSALVFWREGSPGLPDKFIMRKEGKKLRVTFNDFDVSCWVYYGTFS